MKNVYKISSIILLITISFSNFSCSKTDLGNLDEYDISFESVESVMQTEAMLNVAFIDVFNIGLRTGAFYDESSAVAKTNVGSDSEILGGSMTIRRIEGDNPYSLVIADWTDVNKADDYGFNRRGGIVANVKSLWNVKGSRIDIGFGIAKNIAESIGEEQRDAYFFNDYKIEGEVVLENLGEEKYRFVIVDGVVTSTDGKIAHRDSDLFLQWVEGKDTPKDIKDDVWHIYGSVNGITSNGIEYEIVIEKSNYLTKSICKYPTKGVADFVIQKVKFSLDYAPEDEACDNIAEVDFYGKKKIIELGEEEK